MFFSRRASFRLAVWCFGCLGASLVAFQTAHGQETAPRPGQNRASTGPRTNAAPQSAPVNRPPVQKAPPRSAQPSGASPQVALIDIAKVFKSHPGFNQQLEAVKADVTAFEKDMVAKRNKITSEQSRLAEFNVGSPEYKQTDAAITKQMSDLQVSAQLKKKDLLIEEARIYYQAYNEVLAEVQAIATRYNINLVLRYDSMPIDPLDRNSVLQGVNRPVVYQNGLDITDMVLESLTAKYQKVSARP